MQSLQALQKKANQAKEGSSNQVMSAPGSAPRRMPAGNPQVKQRPQQQSMPMRDKTHSRRLQNCLDRLRKQGLLVNFYEKLITEEVNNVFYDNPSQIESPNDELHYFLAGSQDLKGQRVTLEQQLRIRYQEYLMVRDMLNRKLPTLSCIPKAVEIRDIADQTRIENLNSLARQSSQYNQQNTEQQKAKTKLFQSVPVVYLFNDLMFNKDTKDNLGQLSPRYLKEQLQHMLLNPHISSRCLGQITDLGVAANLKKGDLLPEQHRSLILNLSQNFFSNVVQDERQAFQENSQFLKMFKCFLECHLNGGNYGVPARAEAFSTDDLGQVRIDNKVVLQVLKTLFEGQSRKLPAFNYLRQLFEKHLSKVSIYEVETDLEEALKQYEDEALEQKKAHQTMTEQERLQNSQQIKEAFQMFGQGVGRDTKAKLNEATKDGPGKLKAHETEGPRSQVRTFGMKASNEEKISFEGLMRGDVEEGNMPSTKRLNAVSKRLPPVTNNQKLKDASNLSMIYSATRSMYSDPFGVDEEDQANQYNLSFFNQNQFMQEGELDRINNINKNNFAANSESTVLPQYGEEASKDQKEEKDLEDMIKDRRVHVTDAELKNYNPHRDGVQIDLPVYKDKDTKKEKKDKKSKRDKVEGSEKDMTYYCLNLCHQIFAHMTNSFDRVPFNLRAMLKMLVLRARNRDNHKPNLSCKSEGKQKILLKDDEVYLIAEMMIGCWLNTGFRNPECFGLNPSLPQEISTQDLLFQSTRQIFEHLMMMQTLPNVPNKIFDIQKINHYIKKSAPSVLWYWTQIVNVDYSELQIQSIQQINNPDKQEQSSEIEVILVQLDDLKTILTLWRNDWNWIKAQGEKETEDQNKYQKAFLTNQVWIFKMRSLLGSKQYTLYDLLMEHQFRFLDAERNKENQNQRFLQDSIYGWDPRQEKPLSRVKEVADRQKLGTPDDPRIEWREDQYLLIIKKSEKTPDWKKQLLNIYKKKLKEFCQNELIDTSNVAIKEEDEEDEGSGEDDGYFEFKVEGKDKQDAPQSARSKQAASPSGQPSNPPAQKEDQKRQQSSTPLMMATTKRRLNRKMNIDQVFGAVYTIYYNLMDLITQKAFVVERVRDVTKPYTVGLAWNLSVILDSLRKDDMVQPKRTTSLQLICSAIKRQMKRIGIENDAEQQERLLRQFIHVMQQKLKDHQLKIDELKLLNESMDGDCNYFRVQCCDLLEVLQNIEFNDRMRHYITEVQTKINILGFKNEKNKGKIDHLYLTVKSKPNSNRDAVNPQGLVSGAAVGQLVSGGIRGQKQVGSRSTTTMDGRANEIGQLGMVNQAPIIDVLNQELTHRNVVNTHIHQMLEKRYSEYIKFVEDIWLKEEHSFASVENIPAFITTCCKRLKKHFRRVVQADNVQTIAYAGAFDMPGEISDVDSSFSGATEYGLGMNMSMASEITGSTFGDIKDFSESILEVDPLRLCTTYKFFIEYFVLQQEPKVLGQMLGYTDRPHQLYQLQHACAQINPRESVDKIFEKIPELAKVRDFVDNFIMRRIHQVVFDLGNCREFSAESSNVFAEALFTNKNTKEKTKKRAKVKLSAKDERIHKHLASMKKFNLAHLSKEEQRIDLYEDSIQLFMQLPEEETPQKKLALINKALRHANVARAFTHNHTSGATSKLKDEDQFGPVSAPRKSKQISDRMSLKSPKMQQMQDPQQKQVLQHSYSAKAPILRDSMSQDNKMSFSEGVGQPDFNEVLFNDKLAEFYKFLLSHVCQRSDPKYLKLYSQLSFTVLFDIQTPFWDKTRSDAKDLLGFLEVVDINLSHELGGSVLD